MAHYPLDREHGAGEVLAGIADQLRDLIKSSASVPHYLRSYRELPSAIDNDEHEDVASDGGYEMRLKLALDLIEQCLKDTRNV